MNAMPCVGETASQVPYGPRGIRLDIVGAVHGLTTQLHFSL